MAAGVVTVSVAGTMTGTDVDTPFYLFRISY